MPSEGNPNNYEGESYVVKYFSPGKQIDPKTGEEKDAMFPRFQHKIVVRCLRSGRVFVFTGTKAHKRAPWKYKGNGHEGLSVPCLQAELARMMGEEKAHTVVAGVVGDAIPLAMFKMMFPEVAAA